MPDLNLRLITDETDLLNSVNEIGKAFQKNKTENDSFSDRVVNNAKKIVAEEIKIVEKRKEAQKFQTELNLLLEKSGLKTIAGIEKENLSYKERLKLIDETQKIINKLNTTDTNISVETNLDVNKLKEELKDAKNTLKTDNLKIDIDFNLEKVAENNLSLKETKNLFKELQSQQETLNNVINNFQIETDDDRQELDLLKKKYIEVAETTGDLKDRIGDIRAQTEALSGNVGERLSGSFSKFAESGIRGYQAVTGAAALFGGENKKLEETLIKLNAVSALADGIKGFSSIKESAKNFFLVLKGLAATNPFTLILLAILAIGTALFALKDKFAPVKIFFDTIGIIISKIIQSLKDLSDFFGFSAFAAEDAAQRTIDAQNKINKNLQDSLDYQIRIRKAKGQESLDLELKKAEAELELAKKTFEALNQLRETKGGSLVGDELKQFEDAANAINKSAQDLNIKRLEIDKALSDKQKIARDKAIDEYKKFRDKIKSENDAIIKQGENAIKELGKRLLDAELDSATQQERIAIEKQITLDEVKLIEDRIKEKNRVEKLGNDLTPKQQQEFNEIRLLIQQKYEQDLIDLEIEAVNKRLDDDNAATEKLIDSEKLALDTRLNQFKEAYGLIFETQKSELLKRGASQDEFDALELRKQSLFLKKELELLQQASPESLGISDTEFNTRVLQLQNQVSEIANKVKVDEQKFANIGDRIIGSIFKSFTGTEINSEQLAALNQGLSSIATSISSLLDSAFKQQEDIVNRKKSLLDQELSFSDERISTLEGELQKETDLASKGLSNRRADTLKRIEDERIKQEGIKKQQDSANAELRKIAKQRLQIETATQAAALITSSANLYATLSPIPFVGIPLAIAAIGALFAAFAVSKSQAFEAVNTNTGLAEGGFSGFTTSGEKYSERGLTSNGRRLHAGEYVANQVMTEQNKSLFLGMHYKDKFKVLEGIRKLQSDFNIKADNSVIVMNSGNDKELKEIAANTKRTTLIDKFGNLIVKDIYGTKKYLHG